MHELTLFSLIASVDGTSGVSVLPVGLVGGVKRGRWTFELHDLKNSITTESQQYQQTNWWLSHTDNYYVYMYVYMLI